MAVPTCAELASDPVEDRYDDMVNPPGLTNFLGAVQVDHDPVAVRSVNFAPYSHGDTITAQLLIDGRLARSFGEPVTVVWRPDRVERSTTVDGLLVETVTACPPGVLGVVVDVRIRSLTGARSVTIGFALDSTLTRSPQPWAGSTPPTEPNTMTAVEGRAAVVGAAATSAAVSVQGLDVPTARFDGRRIVVDVDLPATGESRIGFVHVIGGKQAEVVAAFGRLAADVPAAIKASEDEWNAELAAVFEPGNARWSGSLPELHTSNAALRQLYHLGVLGVAIMRRDSAASHLGRVYDTLTPRYWQTTTFIWDYMLSSIVHALLDPAPMRRQLAHWISVDIHTHFGTEWQTGAPAGYWYAVNDYAMTRLVRDYVRFSGDSGFLDESLAAADGAQQTVADHVVDWARAWQGLRGAHGLADYGEMDNLLECVSTYTHEIAGFNATNVWALRAAAELADSRDDAELAQQLRKEAAELATAVGTLYAGEGRWLAGQPDGSAWTVTHCLDFSNVAFAMSGDLTDDQRADMVRVFVDELQTDTWLRALSPWDPDAGFSLRPDHQWNGAYTAWPADAARALYELGRDDIVASWLPGLARSANQGPFGQAHFTTEAAPDVNGGARKAPPQFPYLIDWACSSSGAWVDLVLQGVFGLSVPVTGDPSAAPRLSAIDPDARLTGLVVRGRRYTVTAAGLLPED